MTKKKEKTNYSQEQIEELAGNYKHSDNSMPIEKQEALENLSDGDGIATKRPQ